MNCLTYFRCIQFTVELSANGLTQELRELGLRTDWSHNRTQIKWRCQFAS